jgi:hypothetical protein
MANKLSQDEINAAMEKYRLSLMNIALRDNSSDIRTVSTAVNSLANTIDCGDSATVYENIEIIDDI